ncbi:hypothetical protein N7508_006655 [Penicillium antarcticum]|uniref:uncharacterized protein n=1 Tax=Penicillium antarcticum TaxID=416450 RepID=UPI002385B905|nr:uncharacterized protein N7508_006655 [Penicillium antarcticum]KAJ5301792.1 hypothetical protein N7508_006655 [Penicillium antarcticum]
MFTKSKPAFTEVVVILKADTTPFPRQLDWWRGATSNKGAILSGSPDFRETERVCCFAYDLSVAIVGEILVGQQSSHLLLPLTF